MIEHKHMKFMAITTILIHPGLRPLPPGDRLPLRLIALTSFGLYHLKVRLPANPGAWPDCQILPPHTELRPIEYFPPNFFSGTGVSPVRRRLYRENPLHVISKCPQPKSLPFPKGDLWNLP